MRGGKVESSEAMYATQNRKLMAWQTPMQNAFLVWELRKYHPPPPLFAPSQRNPWARQSWALSTMWSSGFTPTSLSSTSHAVLFPRNKKEKARLLSKHRANSSGLGDQLLHGHFVIFHNFCALRIIVHFSGESIHCFIRNSTRYLTLKKVKNHYIRQHIVKPKLLLSEV